MKYTGREDDGAGFTAAPNLALNRPASSSSIFSTSCIAAKANDGSDNAFDGCGGWSPSGADAQPWWQVDLGSAYRITGLELVTRQNCCDDPGTRQNFEVRASNDASFSSSVVLGSQGSTPLPFKATWKQSVNDATAYRYVRATKPGYFFIAELRVLGSPMPSTDSFYYYRDRYYDPSIGRFISEDRLGFGAGVNFYAYVNNNPLNANDPSGLCPTCLVNLMRAAFTVVNAARTAVTVSQAAAIGAGTSVAVGGAIRGATGQSIFDANAMTFDAVVGGAFGVGGQAYNALRVAGSSPMAKGFFAEDLARGQLGGSVLGEQISVAAGGARPRLDFLTQVGGDLIGVEAKYGNAALSSAQRTGYGAINAGESSSLFGKNAIGTLFRGTEQTVSGSPVSSVDILRFGALDGSPSFSSYLGGAIGGATGGFLLYPNKPNTNQAQSVYGK